MPESETEDEILARIETALQKIAANGKPARRGNADGGEAVRALDKVISRLKSGLEPGGAPAGGAPADAANTE